ncbi:MAG: hypothetical protein JKY96_05765 [Phycisphaerales bacterium]|nr:hypothetical protein [Phycisphaerales bacterium]
MPTTVPNPSPNAELTPVAEGSAAVTAPHDPTNIKRKPTLFERAEAFISKLSTRNNFWHRVCSLIWLPYAFRSGITMKRIDEKTFKATLPFRRFNKNWYNAMAGAALLGNSEIAGGTYVFGMCGGDYTVVCKHLEYKFLRPCLGPAEYRITPRDDIKALVEAGGEFNALIVMDIVQMLPLGSKKRRKERKSTGKPPPKPKRVGRCYATFHITPKAHHKNKKTQRQAAIKISTENPAENTES